ncbi:Retrovirus-related Pol polyprotein from transposon RE1 [Bienertia sinuspersici]
MVISWILNTANDSIKKFVMFMTSASEIWKHLEKSYSITNGAKKYSLNKQLYETKQQNRLVSEYYTNMRTLWVELESLTMMPPIIEINTEISAFMRCFNEQKEELKLFQFLNGLDNDYASQRRGSRWTKGRQEGKPRLSANACTQGEGISGTGIIAEQLEQLLRLLPTPSKGGETDSNDEMEANFVEIVTCNFAQTRNEEWIIDSRATHHMSRDLELIKGGRRTPHQMRINLPNGKTSEVAACGAKKLNNGLSLRNIMCIPSFRHNLLSVQKLAEQENYKVLFYPSWCIIQDAKTSEVRGVDRAVRGVYYLINQPVKQVLNKLTKYTKVVMKEGKEVNIAGNGELSVPTVVDKQKKQNLTTLWHKRLGHAPLERINKIEGLKGFNKENEEECITCAVAKFTKQPFRAHMSRAKEPFELVHINTWVCTG